MITSPCDTGYINGHAWDKWDKYNIQLHPKVLSIKICVANGLDADVTDPGDVQHSLPLEWSIVVKSAKKAYS